MKIFSDIGTITINPNVVKTIIQAYKLTEFTEQDIFDIVSEQLKSLCEQNIIEKVDDRIYKLTQKGTELLNPSKDGDSNEE